MKIIAIIFLIAVAALQAQLKEFTITPMESPTQFPPIMRSYPEDGALIVFSSVSGLQFESNNNTIDDIREESSKYTLFLKPETQIITVKKNGYREAKIMLQNVKSREVRYYSVEDKESITEKIHVNIITQPAGAKIYVDEIFAGVEAQQKLKPGVHKLRLEMEGYRTQENSIEVTEKKTLFTIPLQAIELAAVTVSSSPDGAVIYINNIEKGITPKSFFLYPGTYRMRLSKSGCFDSESDIVITESQVNKFDIQLKKNVGYVNISVIPSTAEITINREKVTAGNIELAPGKYKVAVSSEDYITEEETIDIVLGAGNKREYKLKEKTGGLVVMVTPDSAHCMLLRNGVVKLKWDGAKQERQLQTGLYELTVSAVGYATKRQKIVIKELGTENVDITLEKSGNSKEPVEILDDFAAAARKQKPELFTPKDEFESTSKYQARVAEGVLLINKLRQESGFQQQHQANSQAQLTTDLKIDEIGAYDADGERFVVRISGIRGEVFVPANEARSFKANKEILQVSAEEKLSKDSSRLILIDVTIKNPQTNSIYTFKQIDELMIFVKGGWFEMGSNSGERNEKPLHKVWVDDFYIGKYEVTQKEWVGVMGSNPSRFKGSNLPVENISWEDTQVFLQKLNEQTGKHFRLPTEAEWEYAARGGIQSRGYQFSGSNNIDEVAWYNFNADHSTNKIGLLASNELGIHDMSGNVWEWCSDWYDEKYYLQGPEKNPSGPVSGSSRVLRGGSWSSINRICRLSFRYGYNPDDRNYNFGFRVVQD